MIITDYATLYNTEDYSGDWRELHAAALADHRSAAAQVVRARVALQSLRHNWRRVNEKIKAGQDVSSFFLITMIDAVAEAVRYASTAVEPAEQTNIANNTMNALTYVYGELGLEGIRDYIEECGKSVKATATCTDW